MAITDGHGTHKITEDNMNSYYASEHGIKVISHSGEWAAYYRLGENCDLLLIAFSQGVPPAVLSIAIRSYEDLTEHHHSLAK